ncbi:kinase [Peribacillus simplex]|uniref:GHMP family kinase ATP-binding protein n=1 Tax=Peribacillus simplex TaxID=1478 RepID=UPI003D2BCF28
MIVQANQNKFAKRVKFGHGSAFGTFGELLQGVLIDKNRDFLVTLPISIYSHATYICEPRANTVTVFPSCKQKSKKLVTNILKHYGLPTGGHLEIQSNLPVGKGFASSSADLVAVVRAIADCFQVNIPVKKIQYFLAEIEPTDGVMYAGVVSFYHRDAELCDFIGQLPKLSIVSIDEGGMVDTVEFNKIPKNFSDEEKIQYNILLKELTKAIRAGDVNTIGKISTCSAIMHQRLRPKKTLEQLMAICEEIKGLGVVIAHSGTCLGILLSNTDKLINEKISLAKERLLEINDKVMIYHSWNESDGWGFQTQ